MDNHEEIKSLLEQQGVAFEDWKASVKSEFEAERKERESLEMRINRGGLGGGNPGKSETPDAAAYKAAFLSYCRKGDDSNLAALEVKVASVGSDPQGGYTVPEQMADDIERYLTDTSAMRSISRIATGTANDYKQLVSTGGVASGWVGELEDRPVTADANFELVTIPNMEVYSNPSASQTLLDDAAFDFGGFLVEEIGESLAAKEGDAFINGDGVRKPRGFLTYETDTAGDATRAHNKLQYIATGTSAAFPTSNPADKLLQLVYSLKKGYRRNASWVMNGDTIEVVRKFKDGMGNYLWRNGDSLSGQPDTLLGYAVAEDDYAPDIGADAYAVAFGDFKRGYTIVDRMGIRVLRDPYTAKPKVAFYTTKRTGGGCVNMRAIKVLKFSAS